jgi:hypothetical protein
MLMEPLQRQLIPTLILSLPLTIRQIPPRAHEPMHLIPKRLHMLINLERGIVLRDILLRLIHTRQHHHRNLHFLRIARVNQRRARLHRRLERRGFAREKRRHLGAPAVADDAPGADVLVVLVGGFDDGGDLGEVDGRSGGFEPFA